MHQYRNRIILGIVLALVIYVGLLLVLDSGGQITEGVIEALRGFPWLLLIPLSLLQVVAGISRFLVWHYYLGVIDARDRISLGDSLIIFIFGFTMVVSPGKAAELLKAVFLKLKTNPKVPVARSAPIVIAERLVDGIAVIVILTLVLLVAGPQIALGEYLALSQAITFSSAALLGFCLVAVQVRPLAYVCLGIVARLPLVRRLQGWLTDLYESSREIFQPRHVLTATLLGLGIYMSSTTGLLLLLAAFGVEVTLTLILQAMFIVGVTSAIGALSFVPNGAGITEVSNAAMLMAIVAPANPVMTLGVAMAVSLLQGFFHKWFRVLAGLTVAVIYRDRLFTPAAEAEIAALEHDRHNLGAEPA